MTNITTISDKGLKELLLKLTEGTDIKTVWFPNAVKMLVPVQLRKED